MVALKTRHCAPLITQKWAVDVVVGEKKEVDVVVVGIVTIFEGTIGEMTIFGVAIDATIEGIQCRTATSITKEVQE